MKQAGTGLVQVKINDRPGKCQFYSLSITLNYLSVIQLLYLEVRFRGWFRPHGFLIIIQVIVNCPHQPPPEYIVISDL